jgi:hypothetical protein
MTETAGELSSRERRSLWAEVVRWPLAGGMLGGVLLLTLLAVASALAEGGFTADERDRRAMTQAVILLAALAVLGHYAWRAVACTFPVERPVPWTSDPQETQPAPRRVALFLAALLFAFAPLVLWMSILRQVVHAPAWLDWVAILATASAGAVLFPLGLAANVATGSPFAALPGRVLRMRRAEPRAARVAATTSMVFVGLLVLSAWMATALVRRAPDSALPGEHPNAPDMVGIPLRVGLAALRATGFYAALVSFRVSGLLLREVPQIRESLA